MCIRDRLEAGWPEEAPKDLRRRPDLKRALNGFVRPPRSSPKRSRRKKSWGAWGRIRRIGR
eukprot:8449941-Pyramimonas_sp.AAC.1